MKRLPSLGVVRVGLEIALWRHGWAWLAALAVLASAACFHALITLPWEERLAATQREAAREAAARRAGARPAALPSSEAQELAVIETALTARGTPTELVQRMTALARQEQVALLQSDYQQQAHPGTGLLQIQVHQPVRASYPQLRAYIEAVLRAMPNASLDQVSVRRDTVAQSQLEVRLRWSLWLRPQTLPAAPARTPAP